MYLYYIEQIFQVLIINEMLELCMQKSDVFSAFSFLYAIFLNFGHLVSVYFLIGSMFVSIPLYMLGKHAIQTIIIIIIIIIVIIIIVIIIT